MLSNIGVPGLILILVIALVIFGPKKLPEIGRAVGQTLKEFKKSTNDIIDDNETETTKKIAGTSEDQSQDKKEIDRQVKRIN